MRRGRNGRGEGKGEGREGRKGGKEDARGGEEGRKRQSVIIYSWSLLR